MCSMPNLKPVPDSVEHILEQVEAIEKDETAKVAQFVEKRVKGGYEVLAQAQRQTILWVNHVNNNI